MKINKIDTQIIEFIKKFKDLSLWNIVKKIFLNKDYSELSKDEKVLFQSKYMLVKSRLKDMQKEGIVRKEKSKDEIKIIIDDTKIIKKRVRLSDGNKERLFIKAKEGWIAYDIR